MSVEALADCTLCRGLGGVPLVVALEIPLTGLLGSFNLGRSLS